MFTALWLAVKKIPWQVWGLLGLLVALWFFGQWRYDAGQADVQAKWDDSIKKGKVIVAKLKEQQFIVTTKVVTETVYRDKIIREKGKTIYEQVPVYITADTPDLPGAFRVLHDAAVFNRVPGAADYVQAFPVSATTATSTIVRNYEACHLEASKLVGLWDWVQGQRAAYLESCKSAGVSCSKDK